MSKTPESNSAAPLPKVVVAEPIAEEGISAMRERCAVVVAVGSSREGLLSELEDADALIVRSGTRVDEEMISAAPRLRVIGRAGIGVDNIDLEAATRAGVLVVNAPDANTISAAEHTMALLLAQARHVASADASLRAGRWDRSLFRGVELHGKTLGIIGLGRIGTLVAQRASAFGMRILAYDPYVGEDRSRRVGVELADFDSVIAKADFLTVHLPRTRATEGLISADAFAKMKPTARVINAARGGIVDEGALAEAIRSGQIAGAAVDVFADEPTTSSPLFELDGVVVTPHLGASTEEAQGKAGIAVAESVADALAGDLVLAAVNLDVGPEVGGELKPYLPLAESLGQIFVAFSRGLPGELTVCAQGSLAESPARPLALGALRGALQGISEETVSYVNAPMLAEARGVQVRELSTPESAVYRAMVRLTGTVEGTRRVVAGTIMERKGPVLIEVDEYEMELPITEHMLLIRNEDVPGMIGKVGTYLGDLGINIADMVVGRHRDGGAMMGICIDRPLDDEAASKLMELDGVAAARHIDLS
jgi:D-3-phosphoglycerate dehydrogenase